MKISVVMPIFNGGEHVSASIRNIMNQSYSNIELLCVNDASEDSTPSVLSDYAKNGCGIRILTHETNKGVSAARNTGIRAASGDWLCFIDADDRPEPDFCRRLLDAAQTSGADIAKGCYLYPDGLGASGEINRQTTLDKNRCCAQLCSCLFRREFLLANKIMFQTDLAFSEDNVFMVQAALAANAIAIDDEACLNISLRKGSATYRGMSTQAIDCHIKALNRIWELMEKSAASHASRSWVLAFLFVLVAKMASRNSAPAIRNKAMNALGVLFAKISASDSYKRELFASFLPESLRAYLGQLEGGDCQGLFRHFNRSAAALCRARMGRMP